MTGQVRAFNGDLWLRQSLLLRGGALQLLTDSQGFGGDVAYSRAGRKAKVYKATFKNRTVAMKVFLPRFVLSETALSAIVLVRWSKVPGLKVLEREVIDAETAASMGQTGLSYSVVMPWIEGRPWADVLDQVTVLKSTDCLVLARRTAEVLAGLEQRQLVHADISSSNVIIQGAFADPHIELIDVEDMYHPTLTLDMPFPPDGSPGYSHPHNKGKGCRNPYGDRFAGAILLTEMLTWHEPAVRALVDDISLFTDAELGHPGRKFTVVRAALARYSSTLARLFDRVWDSKSLKACPTIREWRDAVDAVPRAPGIPAARFDLNSLLVSAPQRAPRSPIRLLPQTNLIDLSVCPECGKPIPFRSPASHAPTCSHHPSQSAAKTLLAKYLDAQRPASVTPPTDLMDLMRKFQAPEQSQASAKKPLPRYDDVSFRPITDPSPRAKPKPAPAPPNTQRFGSFLDALKLPAPIQCDVCFRFIRTVDGKETGHTWTCRKGPFAWVWNI